MTALRCRWSVPGPELLAAMTELAGVDLSAPELLDLGEDARVLR